MLALVPTRNVKELRRFLGMVQYYSKMLKDSASGCQISIWQVKQLINTRKVIYTFADHCHVYESHTALDFKDDSVGPRLLDQEM
jgi:hypothetical protein